MSRTGLATAIECPEQFLSKVLQNLARAGLVISHRGNTGGFELPQPVKSVTLREVVEAIEGPIRLNLCLTSDKSCSRQKWCPAHGVWAEAQEAVAVVLQKATIGELAMRGVAPDSAPQPDVLPIR